MADKSCLFKVRRPLGIDRPAANRVGQPTQTMFARKWQNVACVVPQFKTHWLHQNEMGIYWGNAV